MGRDYPKIKLLNCYIGQKEDFSGKKGFKIFPIKSGLCIIEEYPGGFLNSHKVLQVHINLTYYDQRVRLINSGKLEGNWDWEDGISDPLSTAVKEAWGIIVPEDQSSISFLGIRNYAGEAGNGDKKISL